MFILICALCCVLAFIAFAIANRFSAPPRFQSVIPIGQSKAVSPQSITISTWNIGYAGMGKDADFFLDLGTQKRPTSGRLVDENLAQICDQLPKLDSDVILIQEAAKPSWLTYGRDVLETFTTALKNHTYIYGAEARTRLLPQPFGINVGNAIYSRITPTSAERRRLPLEPTFKLGIFRKCYQMHIMRIGTGPHWVIINIHLSTFDSAEDDVRRKQVAALLDFAKQEHAKGNHVVIGGDWNLRLTNTKVPHTTDGRYLFWIRDFPKDMQPNGWQWAVDPTVPTVRTAHQPYTAGDNYVCNIDGFLVSPNVKIDHVAGTDLQFAHTDHHPVTARLTALS